MVVASPLLAADMKWIQEPTKVMGIELGVPLSPDFPDCQTGSRVDRSPPRDVCVYNALRATPDAVLLGNLPFSDLHISGVVQFFRAKVSSINLDLPHQDYNKIKRILIDRYGPATNVTSTQVTATSGASAPSESLVWQGVRVRIALIERAARIDRSAVDFEDNELSKQKAEAMNQLEHAEASKL